MMYRIFLVEDDPDIASGIRSLLSPWEIDVRIPTDFSKIADEFHTVQPHLVLMDIRLPFFNGYHWCGEIRKISNVPIMFLSSASDNMSMVMAMNMGADDFIAKPFDGSVLVAKVQALLRRAYDYAPSAPVLGWHGAFLNTGDSTLSYEGERIDLTKNEYRILLCLLENKGKTVSREKLMERLWETDCFVDENTLTVNVNRLRKKLDASGLSGMITTKFGVGYLVE